MREVTLRRLACAAAHNRRELDRYALFSDQVEEELEDPSVRLSKVDEWSYGIQVESRAFEARMWRRGRKWLRNLDPATAAEILAQWNAAGCPCGGTNFASHVRTEIRRRGLPDPPLPGSPDY